MKERQEVAGGSLVRDTEFIWGNIFFGFEGSQAVPTRPSGRARLKSRQGVGSGKGRAMRNGARSETEPETYLKNV
jgi:hypothetical protein